MKKRGIRDGEMVAISTEKTIAENDSSVYQFYRA